MKKEYETSILQPKCTMKEKEKSDRKVATPKYQFNHFTAVPVVQNRKKLPIERQTPAIVKEDLLASTVSGSFAVNSRKYKLEDDSDSKEVSFDLEATKEHNIAIMILNVGSRCKKTVQCKKKCTCYKGVSEVKQNFLEDLLTSSNLHLIFCSEMPWVKGIGSRVFSKRNIPPRFVYTGGKDAGFIYDNSILELTPVMECAVENSMIAAKCRFERGRLCIRLAEFKTKKELEAAFLCIAWHGPHNGIKKAEKGNSFQELLDFVLNLQQRILNSFAIISGDFNYNFKCVDEKVLNGNFKMYYLERLRTNTDFFLLSMKDRIHKQKNWLLTNLHEFELNENEQNALDHDPLIATLEQID